MEDEDTTLADTKQRRFIVTRLLARMFADRHSTMAEQHRTLWPSFIKRYVQRRRQIRARGGWRREGETVHEVTGEEKERMRTRGWEEGENAHDVDGEGKERLCTR